MLNIIKIHFDFFYINVSQRGSRRFLGVQSHSEKVNIGGISAKISFSKGVSKGAPDNMLGFKKGENELNAVSFLSV